MNNRLNFSKPLRFLQGGPQSHLTSQELNNRAVQYNKAKTTG